MLDEGSADWGNLEGISLERRYCFILSPQHTVFKKGENDMWGFNVMIRLGFTLILVPVIFWGLRILFQIYVDAPTEERILSAVFFFGSLNLYMFTRDR